MAVKKKKLTPLRAAIRSVMVREKCNISQQKIADEVGCSRKAVADAQAFIRQYFPVKQEGRYDQAVIIKATLVEFDEMDERLVRDLDHMDKIIAEAGTAGQTIGYTNCRAGIVNQINANRERRDKYKFTIGLVDRAPEEMIIKHHGLSSAGTEEQIDEQIKGINSQLDELGGDDGDE